MYINHDIKEVLVHTYEVGLNEEQLEQLRQILARYTELAPRQYPVDEALFQFTLSLSALLRSQY